MHTKNTRTYNDEINTIEKINKQKYTFDNIFCLLRSGRRRRAIFVKSLFTHNNV
jgi:hypothetical protein